MGHKYAEIAVTPSVKAVQETSGSRRSYAKMETGEDKNQSTRLHEQLDSEAAAGGPTREPLLELQPSCQG